MRPSRPVKKLFGSPKHSERAASSVTNFETSSLAVAARAAVRASMLVHKVSTRFGMPSSTRACSNALPSSASRPNARTYSSCACED